MAIQRTITFKGLVVVDAYMKVVRPTINDGNDSITFLLDYSSSKGNEVFNSVAFNCDYQIDGENPIAQAYVYLSSLDGFYGSVAV